MQEKVQNYIKEHELLTSKGRVIVGVSGGADSVALVHLLVKLGYDCVIAHCNFHLRMEESDRDEVFVLNLSNKLQIPFYHFDFDTIKYSELQRISIEMAARDLRYAWFYELLEKLDAQAIAVAHHADDSVETLLMNLVRGTGLKGLTGIPVKNGKVVRPLLCCSRSEIEKHIETNNLSFISDSTNAQIKYQRNKFRNVIIPQLEEINPSVRETLYDSLSRFQGNLAIYEQAIEKISEDIVHKESELIKIDIEGLKKQLNIPTVLYELLHIYGFSPAIIEQIESQLDGESGKLFYSDTYQLLKDREYLIIKEKENLSNKEYFISETTLEIKEPISLKLNRLQLISNFQVSKDKYCVHVDISKLIFPLTVRRWQEGDSFYPFGMKNRKKLSDFFIDLKLSRFEKEQCWVLLSGEDIVWVVGFRLDNRFRITDSTKNVLEISVELQQHD